MLTNLRPDECPASRMQKLKDYRGKVDIIL